MYIGEILSKKYLEVKPDDTVSLALDKVNEFHISMLPVVHENDYLGLVTEDQLLAHEEHQLLRELSVSFRFLYLYEYQHIYDALQFVSIHKLEPIPILDKENRYLGTLSSSEILSALNDTLGNMHLGAIIVLELGRNDISFSHLAHLFESENVRIISTAIRDIPDTTKIEITIKVDKQNISALVASLWRFDYVVKATFNDGSQDSDIKERYDILMNYLNL
ncbi:CBS domain-containing protein [Sphingobacterium sp. LRF_L2]|uniref:CBS domain-containing protein n=1 Tax=Sphingobacterium sp. LRF_L2 TaxID=3369421 RepID=UPI003F5E1408